MKRTKSIIFGIIATGFVLPFHGAVFSQTVNSVRGLCDLDDQIVFACRTKKKVISLCKTSGAIGRNLVYRYGLLGVAPELVFPNSKDPRKDQFFDFNFEREISADGRTAHKEYDWDISFESGKYRYVVYDYLDDSIGRRKNGVRIEKTGADMGSVLADIPCNDKPTKMNFTSSNLFELTGR
jgi:hypothetical protein